MIKKILLLISLIASAAALSAQGSLHDFVVRGIDGGPFDMSRLKGKKVLVVNVASKCGLTPQYEKLQALYEKYGAGDFTIVGFPSNDFRGQEPGTDAEIMEFCTSNYGVTFPMMGKVEVTGDGKVPIYRWLTEKALNGRSDAGVVWNFQKFMIDGSGNWVDVAPPQEDPFSERIVRWIEGR